MDPLEINEMGELIRKKRKERKLRLEDLADDHISPATISNIERGVPHVNPEKIRYLMSKLEMDVDRLPDLMVNEQKQLQKLRFQLSAIETMQEMGHSREAVRRMDELDLEDNHPFAPVTYFIKGKHYLYSGRYRRAERAFFNAIRLANLTPYGKKSNIEAAGFNELGRVGLARNDLTQALHYVESGLDSFVEDGEQTEIRYTLAHSKASYLEKLGRIGEAMRVVEELWEEIPRIRQMDTILDLYRMRTDLLRRTGMVDEAIKCGKEGLEIARFNHLPQRTFDLWTSLGGVYLLKKDWEEAELSFNIALKLKGKIGDESAFVHTYTRLGTLYMNQEKWEQGEKMLAEAVRLGKRLGNHQLLLEALLASGKLYKQKEENSNAISYFQQALDMASKYGLKKKQYTALFQLAQCWEGRDSQEFEHCMKQLFVVQKELKDGELDDLEAIV
ncbi:tetratricopeptide repeat protein [Paludifilum halophilum]|uniref:HTH cro/C1-type domain-containing protein n=1 Tax=Paludifilum halophilum TaxID=1642702 RepID=A0A235BB70_9BACL|nr:tetratricopeptide repeat protein [Paludifilum halophilum]OYD09127.1 hypothetical protein CHM34_05010 [Paludifilum halophilum]